MDRWRPMKDAPKDRPILAWCVQEKTDDTQCKACRPEQVQLRADGSYRLCLYHAHGEGLSNAETGHQIIVWGGAFDDSTWEHPNQASLPDWWFVHRSEFECVANPIAWQELDPPPTRNDGLR